MVYLPDKIKKLIGSESYTVDDVGMSDSTVILFEDKVLKIQAIRDWTKFDEAENEYQVMNWLKDKLPVPKVLAYEKDDTKSYLLMTKVSGEMACADRYMRNPEQLVESLAEGLKMLWKVDISNCPFNWQLDRKLQKAKYAVENNLVDIDNTEPDTFGENGFKSPRHLLEWLYENKPQEELVLSHGDFCLPNIFLDNGKVSGYIDLVRTGIADKWQDIALCYRSLIHNYEGRYTGKQYHGFKPEYLFDKLGIEPDWDKIRYYMLLDELF